jgi:hypothetical protein
LQGKAALLRIKQFDQPGCRLGAQALRLPAMAETMSCQCLCDDLVIAVQAQAK